MNQLQKRFSNSFDRSARQGSERGTKYIYLLIAIFIALFLQAFVHNYNIVYLALFFTFAFAFSGFYFGRRNIRALELKLFSMQRSFAHQKNSFTIALSSNTQHSIYDISILIHDKKIKLGTISAQEPCLMELHHNAQKRGKATLKTVRCESYFPLPHQFFFKVFDIDRAYLIYPEPKGVSLSTYKARAESQRADIEDIEGIKEYVKGDKLSHIYWKSLGKNDKLLTKEFSYSDETSALLFDFQTCASEDEARLSQLCLWVLECEKRALEFKIVLPTHTLDSSKRSYDEILSALAQY